jgi:hypothetical protein
MFFGEEINSVSCLYFALFPQHSSKGAAVPLQSWELLKCIWEEERNQRTVDTPADVPGWHGVARRGTAVRTATVCVLYPILDNKM